MNIRLLKRSARCGVEGKTMRMDEAQQREYYGLLRELMTYANERLGVVPVFDVFSPAWPIEPELEEKCLLVLQELWHTPDVIDDFAQEEVYRLSASELNLVRSWKDALFGIYIVLEVQDGTALLVGDGILFRVSGFGETLELGFPVLPVCVEGALLPFGDVIVMQEPMRVHGLPPLSKEEANAYAASVECPPISDARTFRLTARAEKTRALQNKIDYLLNDAEHEDEPSEGFHRGVLYGLPEEKRAELVEQEAVALLESLEGEGVADCQVKPQGQGESTPAQDCGELEAIGFPLDQAVRVIESCTYLYGVIELAEAYRLYAEMALTPISLEEFRGVASGRYWSLCRTGLVFRHGTEYVANRVLSVPCLVHDAVKECGDGALLGLLAAMEEGGATVDELFDALREQLAVRPANDTTAARIQAAYDRFESQTNEYIDQLIQEHRATPRCPLSSDLVKDGWLDFACSLPEAIALRNFLDGIVPDGENEYFFADRMVEDLMTSVVATGSLGSAMRALKLYGYPHEAPSTVKLIRLVINLYQALPSWDDNGWSRREHMERLTGRKVFYAPDGSEIRVSDADPCPCGSGKAYGECCGKRRRRIVGASWQRN